MSEELFWRRCLLHFYCHPIEEAKRHLRNSFGRWQLGPATVLRESYWGATHWLGNPRWRLGSATGLRESYRGAIRSLGNPDGGWDLLQFYGNRIGEQFTGWAIPMAAGICYSST